MKRGSMERIPAIRGPVCAVAVALLATGGSDRARADETQTLIGEVPLCDLGSATYEGVPGGVPPENSVRA